MLLMVILIGVLLVTIIYSVRARNQFRLQAQRLGQAVRTHRTMTGLLVLYGILTGIFLVTGFTPPLLGFLLAFPVLAGVAGGWWETQRDARHTAERVLNQGILVGLLATALPVLLMVAGDLWLAWQTGWYIADPTSIAAGNPVGWGELWVDLLLWAGSFLGLGIILSVVGAFIGRGIAVLPDRLHLRRSTGSSTRQ